MAGPEVEGGQAGLSEGLGPASWPQQHLALCSWFPSLAVSLVSPPPLLVSVSQLSLLRVLGPLSTRSPDDLSQAHGVKDFPNANSSQSASPAQTAYRTSSPGYLPHSIASQTCQDGVSPHPAPPAACPPPTAVRGSSILPCVGVCFLRSLKIIF